MPPSHAFSTSSRAHTQAICERPQEELPYETQPTPRTPSKAPAELEEKIRRRAYELYEQRGRVDGYALHDWLQAEADRSTVEVNAGEFTIHLQDK